MNDLLRALDQQLRERNDEARARVFGPHPCEDCGETEHTFTVLDAEEWRTVCRHCLTTRLLRRDVA